MKKNLKIYLFLFGIFICGYIVFLGSYPLLDPDETRYVTMARDMFQTKDYLTLYLNGEYFFEKPPLFFWLECLGFKFFGSINEWTARLPIVLISLLPLWLLFAICKKVKNTRFAVITCCVLLTSLEYMILTKIAILDSIFTSLVVSACILYFYTFFVEQKNKKYFWILSYIFVGLSVLAKGIPGFIPLGIIFISTIIFKTYKETLKYFLLSLILISAIVLPWHVMMLKMYPDLFFQEYIYKHHILRFLGSDVIHRNQPWYFYFLTLLWGLCPHTFIILPKLFQLKINKIKNYEFMQDNFSKFVTLNIIGALFIFLFFTISKTKLITYILPIYPFLAVLIAMLWQKYINQNDKIIKNSLIVLNSTFLLATLVAVFIPIILTPDLYQAFAPLDKGIIFIVFPFAIFTIKSILKNKTIKVFILQNLFFAILIGFLTPLAFRFDYNLGEYDLIKFAQIAKQENKTISAYMTGRKYSLLYYGDKKYIKFQTEENPDWLIKELNKKDNIVITKNKYTENLPVQVINKGVKYSIVGGIDE